MTTDNRPTVRRRRIIMAPGVLSMSYADSDVVEFPLPSRLDPPPAPLPPHGNRPRNRAERRRQKHGRAR